MRALALLLFLLFSAANPDFVCRRDLRNDDGDRYTVACGFRYQQPGVCVEVHADGVEVFR
jgi:hypothetical protein